jgi:D-alanyl-lipoteichoic acid acyltransferase DltB (MBOAT superfamily)
MFLHTPQYLLFLALVVFLYWIIPGANPRKLVLLLASYFFYYVFDGRFAFLLFGLTGGVYLIGRAIPNSARSKQLMWAGVILNLGVLSIFKFNNFFLASLARWGVVLEGTSVVSGLFLLLPIGISFYTFQGIAYVVEIYRGKLQPISGFWDFALYLAFFPKLIAGPFVRPSQFIAQLENPVLRLNTRTLQQALSLLILGLFKKIVIADSLGGLAYTAFRAANFSNAGDFPAPLFLQGFYLYAFQIYADFSGYTDLARASALLLGFTLPENFRQPYLAETISDFWNRWHMTLTQWFRDYLFNPITRFLLTHTQRKSPRAVQISANVITMLLIGVWHGAAWPFIIWGLWHGLLLSVERLLNIKPIHPWQKVFYSLLSFHLVGIGWVFFASDSLASAFCFLAGLFSFSQMAWIGQYIWPVLLAAALSFGIDLAVAGKLPFSSQWQRNFQPILVTAALVVLVGLLLLNAARGGDTRPFIYGQF